MSQDTDALLAEAQNYLGLSSSKGDADVILIGQFIDNIKALRAEVERENKRFLSAQRACEEQDEASEAAEARLSDALAANKALRGVLTQAQKWLDTWTCTYADDMCGEDAARTAKNRIMVGGGTLAYIADAGEQIAIALAALPGSQPAQQPEDEKCP